MALNYIWSAFFVISFIIAVIRLVFFGDVEIFPALMNSTFDNAKTGFEISLYLTGVLSLWLGLMKIGEKGGVVSIFSKLTAPFFTRLFPGLPKDSAAYGSIIMNLTANMLGLDNAATPMGLKAMKEMQEANKDRESASDSQIMFLVLNTSGLTLIPIGVMVYRAQQGAANPADIFIPILIATYFSTMVGLIAVALKQKIRLLDPVILLYIGGATAVIAGIIYMFSGMEQEQVANISTLAGNVILFAIIISFIVLGLVRRVNLFDAFIEGAKEGFQVAVKIIPYLVAFLVSIGLFRISGAMDYLTDGIRYLIGLFGVNTDFADALPTAFMKPLSGGGARSMMLEAMGTYGVDSFVGKLACTLQGATDTTFYIIAVYFGSVGIKNTRYAVGYGLLADFAGIIAAIIVAYIFFH